MILELSLVGVWVLLQVALVVWLSRVKPSKETAKKYPRAVVFQSTIPLMKAWRKKIEAGDLKVFEEYRKRFFIQYYLCFLVPVFLFFVYLYFKYIYFSPFP